LCPSIFSLSQSQTFSSCLHLFYYFRSSSYYHTGIDYYVGYNRANGPNADVKAARNLVTLYEKENNKVSSQGRDDGYGRSTRIAALDIGEQYVWNSYNGTQYNVYLTVESISDEIDMVISISTSLPAPTSAPTVSCGDLSVGRFQIDLYTDSYGSETTWTLSKTPSTVVGEEEEVIVIASSSEQGSAYTSDTSYTLPDIGSSYCLQENSCYSFEIKDQFGGTLL